MKYFVQKVRTRVSAMRERVALTVCLIAFISFTDVVLGSSVGLSTMQDCRALSGTWKNTHSQQTYGRRCIMGWVDGAVGLMT